MSKRESIRHTSPEEEESSANYWADAPERDAAFQAAMLNEGRVPSGPSQSAGTDSPKPVMPVSIGSCTSSAGWGE